MKNSIFSLSLILGLLLSCGSPKPNIVFSKDHKAEPVRIANDSLEYEIIIIDPGYNTYLKTIAHPRTFYDLKFLESRNLIFVIEWNNRVVNSLKDHSKIYENEIDYKANINYGLEVNYLLYNYFQYAQRKYKMKLGSFRVR
jgi:hypothetical protein